MAEAWGAFQLLERVSESEATENFRAQNDKGELVWLKRARKELLKEEGFAAQLLADLNAAAALQHPSVLPMLAHGEIDGVPYLVQPMVAGWTLDELLSQARGTPLLPVGAARAAALVKPVLDALAAAHALSPSLLHRDLSPDNVMVLEDGRVLLANFGLARSRLRAGATKGLSRAYVSVEQARGQPLDARSEVFAAGLLLFELTCGRLPAEGSAGDVISHIASYELDAATMVNPNIDRSVAPLLAKALAQAPDQRFASAREFAEALAPLVPADAVALVGQWADLIDEEVPTKTIKVQPKTAAPAAASSAAVTTSGSTTAAPRPRGRPPLKSIGLGALAVVAVIGTALRVSHHPVTDLHADWPETVIASTPTSSEVFLDGALLKEKTPVTLRLEPGSSHEVFVRHNTMRSQLWRIQNTKRLEVDLLTGEIHEDPAAPQPATPVPPTPPAPRSADEGLVSTYALAHPAVAPEPNHVYPATRFPIDVELDSHFALWLDNVATREVEQGDRLEQINGVSLFSRMVYGPGRGGYGLFDFFAAWPEGEKLKMVDLRQPLIADARRSLYLFAVSREGGSHTPGLVRHQELQLRIDALRVPLARNVLEVNKLDPLASYCFSAEPLDGEFPPMLGAYLDRSLPLSTDDRGEELEPEVDGKVELGPSLLSPGNHTLRHTGSAWFSLPTLEGTTFLRVKLHFGLCGEKKKTPASKKKSKALKPE